MEIKKVYLPGKEEVEYREYRYVQILGCSTNEKNFISRLAGAHEPLIPQNGGVISENFIIITPENDKFYGISYSKDILGWRTQIEKGAKILHYKIAKIENGLYFQIENGNMFKLEDCLFERYNFYNEAGTFIGASEAVEKGEIL